MGDSCIGKTNRECYCAGMDEMECLQEYLRLTDPGDEWKDKYYSSVFPADGFKLQGRFGYGLFADKYSSHPRAFLEFGGGTNFSLQKNQKLHLILRGNLGGDVLSTHAEGKPEEDMASWGGHINGLFGLGIRVKNVIFELGPRLGMSMYAYNHGEGQGIEKKTGFIAEGYFGMGLPEKFWDHMFLGGGYDTALQAPYVMLGFGAGTYSL